MVSSLIIIANPTEVRVAVCEGGIPVELHVERRADRGVLGNIYRGKVVLVLPEMQAAFVEIGIERTGFLYVKDALPRPVTPVLDEDASSPANDLLITKHSDGNGEHTTPELAHQSRRGFRQAPQANIADVLKNGQQAL